MHELLLVAMATQKARKAESRAWSEPERLATLPHPGGKVLILDGDRDLVDLLAFGLKRGGHEVVATSDPGRALDMLEQDEPNLLVLDPHGEDLGWGVLAEIRARCEIPIIILSQRGSEADKVRGLDLGADDYITKPFNLQELLARVRSALRRAAPRVQTWAPSKGDVLQVGPLTMNPAEHTVFMGGKLVPLSKTERRLLHLIMLRAGSVVSWREAALEVWGYDDLCAVNTVRVTVHRLRRKLEDDPANPSLLRTIPGEGIILKSA